MTTDPRTHLIKALDLLLDVICVVDADGRYLALSGACEQVLGYKPEELIGKPMIDLVLPEDRQRTLEAARGVMVGDSLLNFENRYMRKDGRIIHLLWSARWSDADQVRLAVARDVTLRKHAELQLEQLAHHDALTGLPNRTLFEERLQQAMTRSKRHGHHAALLYVDLDDFKPVNDAHGHAAGDTLLQQVARRLAANVRESDTVCRLGGDEFVVVLDHLPHRQAAERIARALCAAIREPFLLEDQMLQISVSIGIALFPDDALDAHALTLNADTAMYGAKRLGRNRWMHFSELHSETTVGQ